MITVIVFISLFVIYVTVVFFRGVYREKKDKKLKEKTNLEEDIN